MGSNVEGRKSPPISTIVAFELEQLGVSRTAIIEEPCAFTSQEQITNCATIVREKGWPADRVAILAPCWQFGRIIALMAKMQNIEPFSFGAVHLLSMERVLAAEDSAWNTRFVEWYVAPEVQKMFWNEALGAGQLWAGHQPRWPNPFRGFTDPLA